MHTSRALSWSLLPFGVAALAILSGEAPLGAARGTPSAAVSRLPVHLVDIVGDADNLDAGDAADIPTRSVHLGLALNTMAAAGLAGDTIDFDDVPQAGAAGRSSTGYTHIFEMPDGPRVADAVLRLRLRSEAPLSAADVIRLDAAVHDLAEGRTGAPVIAIEHLVGAPPVPGQPYDVEIHLVQVPVTSIDPRATGGVPVRPDDTLNLLGDLADGTLDVIVSGTSIVDIATLEIEVHPGSRPRPAYTIEAIPTLGGSGSFAYAINDWGDVVGSSQMPGDDATHSFVYRNGASLDLAPLNSGAIQTVGPSAINDAKLIASGIVRDGVYYPALHDAVSGTTTILGSFGGVTANGFSGVATALNRSGHAVGYSYVDAVTRRAFLYFDGNFVDLGSAGGYSAATGINDAGEIVGYASDSPAGVARAFVHRDGRLTTIDPFGAPRNESYATAINNLGHVVGEALTARGTAFNAFVHDFGVVTNLGTLPGGYNSTANSINDKGQVVGVADYPYVDRCRRPIVGEVECIRYAPHAFLYQGGVMRDLNTLIRADSGWDVQWAYDINESGQITGYGVIDGRFRAFVATPTAERRPAATETRRRR